MKKDKEIVLLMFMQGAEMEKKQMYLLQGSDVRRLPLLKNGKLATDK